MSNTESSDALNAMGKPVASLTRMGIIPVSFDIIKESLRLPSDVEIVDIEVGRGKFDYHMAARTLRVKVCTTNPEYTVFPIVHPGDRLLEMSLVHYMAYDITGNIVTTGIRLNEMDKVVGK